MEGLLSTGPPQCFEISHCPASELNRGLSDFAEIQATIRSSTGQQKKVTHLYLDTGAFALS